MSSRAVKTRPAQSKAEAHLLRPDVRVMGIRVAVDVMCAPALFSSAPAWLQDRICRPRMAAGQLQIPAFNGNSPTLHALVMPRTPRAPTPTWRALAEPPPSNCIVTATLAECLGKLVRACFTDPVLAQPQLQPSWPARAQSPMDGLKLVRSDRSMAGAWAPDGTNIYVRGMTDTQMPYYERNAPRLAG